MRSAGRPQRRRAALVRQVGEPPMGKAGSVVSVRFDDDMLGIVDRFAAKTGRDRPDIVRQAVAILFSDGLQAAEIRLTSGLWEDEDAGADEIQVVAMKETLPAGQGRQLIIYTPHRKALDESEIKAAVKRFVEKGGRSDGGTKTKRAGRDDARRRA